MTSEEAPAEPPAATNGEDHESQEAVKIIPAIVGWDDDPPRRLASSQWDDVAELVRGVDHYKWARVTKPTAWSSGTATWFRSHYKDLDFHVPGPAGRGRSSKFVWIRRKPLTPTGQQ